MKTLVGRHNVTTADLLAHLAEVDARGIYRERACSSLYTYCVYELRFSEDEAQRRVQAARTARNFPIVFDMLAEGAVHLTGLLLLAPHLTTKNHTELLARARFRTKREIERLIAEVAPRPDVPARIEALGPRPFAMTNRWQAFTASLRGPVRDLEPGVAPGQAPPAVFASEGDDAISGSPAPARNDVSVSALGDKPFVPLRYRIEFTASQGHVDLLEEARNLLQHQLPDRDIARIHELAMAAFVEQLRKRRQAVSDRARRSAPARTTDESKEPARAQIDPATECAQALENDEPQEDREVRRETPKRHVAAAIRRAVWQRDGGQCTFEDSTGRRCHERAGLEIHHEHAFAHGGPSTVGNLRLLCRAHNALLAERDFGREHILRMKNGGQEVPGKLT